MSENLDKELFLTVRELRDELINSLRPIVLKREDSVGQYLFHICRGVSDSVQAYVTLQEVTNVTGARILVRPCVEAAFRIAAVKKVPETLYQIAHTEWNEDLKFLQAAKENGNKVDLAAHHKKWERQKKDIATLFKGKVLKENFMTAYHLAQTGGWTTVYAFQYRLYCNFTHASLRAIFTWPDFMPTLDHITIGACAVVALEAVRDAGGPTPQLARLRDRLNKLTVMTGIDVAKGTVNTARPPAAMGQMRPPK